MHCHIFCSSLSMFCNLTGVAGGSQVSDPAQNGDRVKPGPPSVCGEAETPDYS